MALFSYNSISSFSRPFLRLNSVILIYESEIENHFDSGKENIGLVCMRVKRAEKGSRGKKGRKRNGLQKSLNGRHRVGLYGR